MSDTKRQEVLALGRLGWPLRRIEAVTGVRRETAGEYLRAAGLAVRAPGGWGRRPLPNPAKQVSTDSDGVGADHAAPPLAPDPAPPPIPGRSPQASACEPYREVIVEALGRGRNAMGIFQDLVDRQK